MILSNLGGLRFQFRPMNVLKHHFLLLCVTLAQRNTQYFKNTIFNGMIFYSNSVSDYYQFISKTWDK